MALQTFTAGQVLTAAQVTSLQSNDFNQTVSVETDDYTLVAADKGTRVVMNAATAKTITVDTSIFNAGDTLQIHNIGAGVCTITAGTATVSTAGSLALPINAGGTLYFTSTGVAIFFPTVASSSASGLELINTTSFSGVASQSVNDVFSATYRNYRIQLGIVNKNSQGFIQMRLRVSGADNSTSAYNNYGIGFDNSGATRNNNLNGQTTWRVGEGDTGSTKASTNIDLFYPNESYATRGLLQYMGESGSGTPFDISMTTLMSFNDATVFTGFTIISSAGVMTGDVSVFGVNK